MIRPPKGMTIAARLRGGLGARVHGSLGPRPKETLELFEFEACPFCRKVREAISMLDLEVWIHPCPKQGTRHRPRVAELGGRAQYPYLVDPNQEVSLYESNDIIRHLYRFYGATPPPRILRLGFAGDLLSTLGGTSRLGAGGFARPSRVPAQRIQLIGYEASAACQRVRERLCELELSYRSSSAAPGSSRASALRERGLSPPVLIDPNTETEVAEADAIVAYLERYRVR